MDEKRIIYYQDERNDEFSSAKIEPKKIDENYRYFEQRSFFWNVCSWLSQNVFSMPIKFLYAKWKFKIQYVGREKLKACQNTGYFIYGNHTQSFADTFLPSLANYPKRNFFIVKPENVSMKGLRTIVELLGAIPIPSNKEAMKNFWETIQKRIEKKSSITIYPEAHIWPYYTKIRPFPSVSFKYPVKFHAPAFCLTNTYQRYGKKKNLIQIVSYIDGPFWVNQSLTPKEQQEDLRNRIYQTMVERSQKNNIAYIEYRKKQ